MPTRRNRQGWLPPALLTNYRGRVMSKLKKPREKFRFYTEWYRAFKPFSMEERGTLFDSILQYGFYGEEKELPTHLKAVFEFLKYQIDKSLENERVSCDDEMLARINQRLNFLGISSQFIKKDPLLQI